jgi:hypothetical protein
VRRPFTQVDHGTVWVGGDTTTVIGGHLDL